MSELRRHNGAAAFVAALSQAQACDLGDAARRTRAAAPADWQPLWLSHPDGSGAQRLGLLAPERAAQLCDLLADTRLTPHGPAVGLHWHALGLSATERSARLQTALEACHAQGWVHGWRHEAFAFWHHDSPLPPPAGVPHTLAVERAGFRFLGMPSHAVHINGFTPDGRLWCGRRALSKATDPGLLDNVTAGGLPAGETPWDCALRELFEEAGATAQDATHLASAGTIRTARQDTGGWHEETLLVYNWTCPEGWTPVNQDGEVAEFLCLHADEVMRHIVAGDFTLDAVASLAHGVGLTHEAATIAPCF